MDNVKPKLSDARKRANAKYNASAYDRIELRIPKGEKEIIKEHAEHYQAESGTIGMAGYAPKGSVTGFIRRAINETMERDKDIPPVDICASEPVTNPQEDVVSVSDNDIPDAQACVIGDSTGSQEEG